MYFNFLLEGSKTVEMCLKTLGPFIREKIRRILAKSRLILDEMCRLYGIRKFHVLFKMRLIFSRINGPNVLMYLSSFVSF